MRQTAHWGYITLYYIVYIYTIIFALYFSVHVTETAANEVATWAGFLIVGADHVQGQLHSH